MKMLATTRSQLLNSRGSRLRLAWTLLVFLRSASAFWMAPGTSYRYRTARLRIESVCTARTGTLLGGSSRRAVSAWQLHSKDNDKDEKEEPPEQEQFDMDKFLDVPFFDPDRVLEDENSHPLLRRFASFVQLDYEMAEAVISGAFFVILIIATQEVLRLQFYGDNYVPFTKGVNPGSLF
jgi:hypothetical protein